MELRFFSTDFRKTLKYQTYLKYVMHIAFPQQQWFREPHGKCTTVHILPIVAVEQSPLPQPKGRFIILKFPAARKLIFGEG